MNNRIEQDHRGIKQRYYPMRGFGSFDAAARFCTAHDELRDHVRPRTRFNDAVSLAAQRRLFGGPLGRGVRAAPGGLTTPATPSGHCRLTPPCGLRPDTSLNRAKHGGSQHRMRR